MAASERSQHMPVGIVVERRKIDHPWQEYAVRPVAVLPGAGPTDEWKELTRGERWVRYHIGTLELELHRSDTESYKVNLSNTPPVVYVVLSTEDATSDRDLTPFLATVSPYEAQDYLDSGEDIVEGVPMPDALIAWVQAFVTRHHVDQPFFKRKRKRYDPDAVGFGRREHRAGRGNRKPNGRT